LLAAVSSSVEGSGSRRRLGMVQAGGSAAQQNADPRGRRPRTEKIPGSAGSGGSEQ